jgi:hypothetical protein
MIHHFRHLLPLLPTDEDGLSFLHYYDSAIQLARLSSREPTESEFEVGISAAQEIRKRYRFPSWFCAHGLIQFAQLE